MKHDKHPQDVGQTKTMTANTPPPNINAQSDDNRVGFMFVLGTLLLYGVWQLFSGDFSGFMRLWAVMAAIPGIFFVTSAIRRLLRPGCKIILRINHGGVTDFRFGQQPVVWESITGVEKTTGWLGLVLPAVILHLVPDHNIHRGKTAWYKILHTLLSFVFPESLIVLCATLDVSPEEIYHTLSLHHQSHQQNRQLK